jgi:hypothetical protein
MRSNTPFEAKSAPLITNQYDFITICNEELFEAKSARMVTNHYDFITICNKKPFKAESARMITNHYNFITICYKERLANGSRAEKTGFTSSAPACVLCSCAAAKISSG